MQGIQRPTWPGWRSLLFVPAINQAMVAKAATRGADALILDLEDAVADMEKATARAAVADALDLLTSQGAAVLIRVNAGALDMMRDLEASVRPGLAAVVVPKSEQPQRLAIVDELLADLESAAGMTRGEVGIVALVETAQGLFSAPELATASPRVMALAFGPEDLALDLGAEPNNTLLTAPASRVVWAARAAGCTAVGFPGPISNFTDEHRLRQDLVLARQLGFAAALCIQPRQLGPCHDAFSVTCAEAAHARRVVDMYQQAHDAGLGVCVLDGQMIDQPIVRRAQEVIARWSKQSNNS